jgi:hypothetical protein
MVIANRFEDGLRMILAQELQLGPFEGPLEDQRCTVDPVVLGVTENTFLKLVI